MEELHRFALNEGHVIKNSVPLFTALEYSRATRISVENVGYNSVAPGVRYFKIKLTHSGLTYRRVELRRVRKKLGT